MRFMQSGPNFATADLLKEGAQEGQTDGVNKTVRICKFPKIDVTSISTIYRRIKFALQIIPIMHA